MNRRLIDANALTDDILKSAVMIDDRGIQTGYEIAIELIKRQPTVDIEPHWIPVEKEMPKKEGEYLVSDKYGGVFIAALFLRDNKGRPISPGWYIERSWALDVIAWAEIPTPYRVEDKR